MSIIRQNIIAGLTVVAAAVAHPQTSQSQEAAGGRRSPWAESMPSRIISNAATGFPRDVVVEVLRQRHQSYSTAKRRELAELVVARAIAEPRVGTLAIVAI